MLGRLTGISVLLLMGCELCDDGHDCAGGVTPIGGQLTDFTLPEQPLEDATIRAPRKCENSDLEAYATDVLFFGAMVVDSDQWILDELHPRLRERGIPAGWGLSECHDDHAAFIVHDWAIAQELGETILELAAERGVTVGVQISIEEQVIVCADEHACST